MHDPKRRSCAILVFSLFLFTSLIVQQTAYALTCYCNECQQDECTTESHRESTCFKSVERVLENNTYQLAYRFGCISGAEDSLAGLQCYANTLKHQEPVFVACCKQKDFCNQDLPEPSESDDPRWKFTDPPVADPSDASLFTSRILELIVLIAVIIGALIFCVLLFVTMYHIVARLWASYNRSDKKASSDSQDSICSFKVNFEGQLKGYYDPHHSGGSSGSTHTYSTSDCMSQKPSDHHQENICGSIENSSTLPDLTSGVGDGVLMERTMARVVDSGSKVPVGSGRFGRVFKVNFHCEDVAVKAFRAIDSESWRREESILRRLSHENIVRFLASETKPVDGSVTEIWMFLEYCPYGSLCDFLDRTEVCGPKQAVTILYSIIKGLHYLHESYSQGYKPPIAHRDIKSKNILMKTPDTCCLADFGHAVVKVDENRLDFGGYERIQVGTIRYMAPEILKPGPGFDITQFHTFAQADLYQFGLVLWEVCHRTTLDILHPAGLHRLPYDGVVPQNPDLGDMIKIVCEDNYRPPFSPYWDKYPVMKSLSRLMVECWRQNPKARMETLGVKIRLKELYDHVTPTNSLLFYHNNLVESFPASPNLKSDKDKTRSNDFTL